LEGQSKTQQSIVFILTVCYGGRYYDVDAGNYVRDSITTGGTETKRDNRGVHA
jgi:hypothetical protein